MTIKVGKRSVLASSIYRISCSGFILLSLFTRPCAFGLRSEPAPVQSRDLFCCLFIRLLEKLKSVYSKLEVLPPDRIVPTVGLNIGQIEVSNTKLVFWDLGGQPGLRSIWEKYYEEAHAVIFVIDSACPPRFEDSKSALEKVLWHEDLKGAPILILANKQDLSEALSAEELARYLDLKKLDERVYMYEAASAFDGMGIKEGVSGWWR
ncbi:ADP-ribosylation factor-like protein 3 [Hibiscus syriacus]|uniref:ADP-ribosylation factor-like protein 3 n=1 Tax=Hibiscus syriacus TaxID=106335 RepID=UPI00192222EA|nr:ADP-ribosylation factor-like protein 3 [Hibiscus syriacus]